MAKEQEVKVITIPQIELGRLTVKINGVTPLIVNKFRDDSREQIEKKQQKKARAARNAARRMLMKEGKVHKGDGKDVDHKVPVSKGGKNTKGNLRVESVHDNRSFDRNADHSLKKNVPFGKRKK